MSTVETSLHEATDAARSLFIRGLVTGSTGNLSVRCDDGFLISQSGSSFGKLEVQDFVKISLPDRNAFGKPSKEWPLHAALFESDSQTQAVIHTHSHYCTLLSCLCDVEHRVSRLFTYTPYARMKTNGVIGVVPYAPPGSTELFEAFSTQVDARVHAYVLRNHGIIVAGQSISEANSILEELEASARLLYDIERWGLNEMQPIASNAND